MGAVSLRPKSRLARGERCVKVSGQGVQVNKLRPILIIGCVSARHPAAGFAPINSEQRGDSILAQYSEGRCVMPGGPLLTAGSSASAASP